CENLLWRLRSWRHFACRSRHPRDHTDTGITVAGTTTACITAAGIMPDIMGAIIPGITPGATIDTIAIMPGTTTGTIIAITVAIIIGTIAVTTGTIVTTITVIIRTIAVSGTASGTLMAFRLAGG